MGTRLSGIEGSRPWRSLAKRVAGNNTAAIRKEYLELANYVIETSATTWYASDMEGTREYLLRVIRVVTKYGIELPNFDLFRSGYSTNTTTRQGDMRSVPHRGSEWVLTVDSMPGPTRYRDVVLTSPPRGCWLPTYRIAATSMSRYLHNPSAQPSLAAERRNSVPIKCTSFIQLGC